MRLFIAVSIPDDVRALLEERVHLIQSNLPSDLKWVVRENWHLTLKFLGETGRDKIPAIEKTISSLAESTRMTGLSFKGVTAFPRITYPRVIVTTVEKGAEAVEGLQLELEERLIELGFQRDKKAFSPHLTLARSRRSTDLRAVADCLQQLDFDLNIPLTMKKITLIKSELYRTGPRYHELTSARLLE